MKRGSYFFTIRFLLVIFLVHSSGLGFVTPLSAAENVGPSDLAVILIKTPDAAVTVPDSRGENHTLLYQNEIYGLEVNSKNTDFKVARWLKKFLAELRSKNQGLEVVLKKIEASPSKSAFSASAKKRLPAEEAPIPVKIRSLRDDSLRHSVVALVTSLNHTPITVTLLDARGVDIETSLKMAQTLSYIEGELLGVQTPGFLSTQGASKAPALQALQQKAETLLSLAAGPAKENNVKGKSSFRTRYVTLPLNSFSIASKSPALQTFRINATAATHRVIPAIYSFAAGLSMDTMGSKGFVEDPWSMIANASSKAWETQIQTRSEVETIRHPENKSRAELAAEWKLVLLKVAYKVSGPAMATMSLDPSINSLIYGALFITASAGIYKNFIYTDQQSPTPALKPSLRLLPVAKRANDLFTGKMSCAVTLSKAKAATEIFAAAPL
jgi:hypothetical protein